MRIIRTKIWLILSLLAAFTMACSLVTGALPQKSPEKASPAATGVVPDVAPTTKQDSKPQVKGPTPTPPAGVYPEPFAEFPEIQVSIPQKYNNGEAYTLPVDLARVKGLENIQLSEKQRSLLSNNGFVTVPAEPGTYREFYQIYESGRYDSAVMFITTDAVYHTYHLLFDKMLRDLETSHFIATLKSLTSAMQKTTEEQVEALKSSPLEEPAKRNLAFFAVASQLLQTGEPVPASVKDMVAAEITLIEAHNQQSISPIWDRDDLPEEQKLIEDYTQYTPRGHYTRSEELKTYFKAMMWYGRLTFRLRDEFETRRALLLVQALRQAAGTDGTDAITLWKNIYEPTVFIVGKSDDLSYQEYGTLSDSVFGSAPDLHAFADDGMFAKFMEAAKTLPPPKINSMWVWINEDKEQATKGFRFMGQRFTLDQYVFGQVVWREVGTDSNPRSLPKGLDLFAAMGSDESYNILKEMGETKYENYNKQFNKVKKEVATLGKETWTQNLYWSWLYSLFPLIEPKGESYPPFMQNQAWTRKDLNTAMGSWTELKHDTILYAKQMMAEMGGGGPDEEPPHGWVEPNPQAYARMRSLAQMTTAGLDARGLTTTWSKNTFKNLLSELTFLQTTAEKELAGEKLSTDDYWHIFYFGGILEQFAVVAADTDDETGRLDISDMKAPLVADVASGPAPDGIGVVALTEAVGEPVPMFVVLPDAPWRIGVGAVFSYYEFTVPSEKRLTDEQWRQQIESGQTPARPSWTNSFNSAD
ncbi:MAG: DUF3160 domain-containing protein [Leptolinea sp.]|jgi:hypothetical protein|nr:DUF3160 domain-containing protein [Leptolinea sp.]